MMRSEAVAPFVVFSSRSRSCLLRVVRRASQESAEINRKIGIGDVLRFVHGRLSFVAVLFVGAVDEKQHSGSHRDSCP